MTSNSSIRYPFYRVFDEKGNQYCDCVWEKHAQEDIVDSGQEEEYNNEEKKFKKNFDGFKFN